MRKSGARSRDKDLIKTRIEVRYLYDVEYKTDGDLAGLLSSFINKPRLTGVRGCGSYMTYAGVTEVIDQADNKHPIQPVSKDEHGTLRFKKNAIVEYLLDNGPFDMNHLAKQGDRFSQEDKEQFAQLIGYSLSGYGDLSYATNEVYDRATRSIDNLEV